MADIGGIYALGAALGAAGVGAVAGGLVQRAKGRQDTALAELQRRQLEKNQRQLAADLVLEVNAAARSAGRAWLSGVERVLQEIELGRAIDIGRIDEEFNQLQSELTQSMYRLAAATTAVPQTPAAGSIGVQPYIERVAETTLLIRSDLLRITMGLPPVHGRSDLQTLARLVGTELHVYAELRTERLLTEYDNVQFDRSANPSAAYRYRRLEQLRSQLASAQADEALHTRLQQTAAAHNQALAAARERREAHGSVEDLEVSLRKAEQAWRAEHFRAPDEEEMRQRAETLRMLTRGDLQQPPGQVGKHLGSELPPPPWATPLGVDPGDPSQPDE
ncbi:hypothetical protein ACIBBE_35645 [Streptomyces sp. NPDC051644]|uniref:hypothetical protein n=1 Tax=Streptomyces sp. NPDC051644 TaxID=3365666 RepID=UPI0037883413